MSDTDDTDDLLLIPPDLFFVCPELEEPLQSAPYYDVVDNLITQVNRLEDRINYIITSPDINTPQQMSRERSYECAGDVKKSTNGYISSTQSTPQKPRTIFKVNSLPPTPQAGRYNPAHSRITKNLPNSRKVQVPESNPENVNQTEKIKLLNEIDDFISNVKSCNKLGRRNLEQEFNASNNVKGKYVSNKQALDLKDVDQMLTNMEKRQMNIETEILNRDNNERSWNEHQNIVPNHVYNNKSNHIPLINTLTATSLSETIPSISDDSFVNIEASEDAAVSSSNSTQVTAFQNVNYSQNMVQPSSGLYGTTLNALKMHQQILSRESTSSSNIEQVSKGDVRNSRYPIHRSSSLDNRPTVSLDSNVKLLSLTDLWGQYAADGERVTNKTYMNKLEEERMRRKHCEQIIQELQLKILEYQEKLAVAVEVDQSKDDAILRFHEAWEKVAVRLEMLTKDKNFLERDLHELQAKGAVDLADAAKKIAYYEAEASKALNLAHGSQEKLINLEKQCSNAMLQIEDLQINLNEIESKYLGEIEKNKQLAELITKKELELNEKQKILVDARKEVAQSKKAVEVCQAEFAAMQTQYTQLELEHNETKNRITELEKQRKKFVNELENQKKNAKELQEELHKSKELNEKNKLELRNFYQDQVEVVVRDKLREFQEQLERAENSMQDEIKSREFSVAKTAAHHIQQIQEKHTLEVQLIEEKHEEEVRLYHVKISQANNEIENLQVKLKEQQSRKGQIAQQLHKVMEAQWLEALKIINSRTPSSPDLSTDQINMLKSKSYNNLEELLGFEDESANNEMRFPGNSNQVIEDYGKPRYTEYGFKLLDETPVTSRQPRSKPIIENNIQKYIQMLLPRNSTNQFDHQQEMKQAENQPTNERQSNWPQTSQDDYKSNRNQPSRDRKHGKPPWK